MSFSEYSVSGLHRLRAIDFSKMEKHLFEYQWKYLKLPSENMWKCRDGLMIPIPKLSDSHLLNIARMLNRRAEDILTASIFKGLADNGFSPNPTTCRELAAKISKDLIPQFSSGKAILEECAKRKFKDWKHTFIVENVKSVKHDSETKTVKIITKE